MLAPYDSWNRQPVGDDIREWFERTVAAMESTGRFPEAIALIRSHEKMQPYLAAMLLMAYEAEFKKFSCEWFDIGFELATGNTEAGRGIIAPTHGH